MERSGPRADDRRGAGHRQGGSVYQLLRMAHALFWLASAIIFTTLVRLSPVLKSNVVEAMAGGATLAALGLLCSFSVGFPLAVMRTARGILLRSLSLLVAGLRCSPACRIARVGPTV